MSTESCSAKILACLKVALGVVSALGVVMMFFGFGTALALDGFGVDVHQVLHGPGDYLAAAAYVVIELFVRGASQLLAPTWLEPLFIHLAFVAIGALLLLLFVLLTEHMYRPAIAVSRRTASRVGCWCRQHIHLWRPPAIAALVAGGGGAIAVLPYLLAVPLLLCLLPFFVGLTQANRYFYETVVEPIQCRQPASAHERRSAYIAAQARDGKPSDSQRPNFATCLQVTSQEGKPHFGRRVIATSESVILFEPITGVVHVVPTKDAVVSFIAALPTPTNPTSIPSAANRKKSAMATRHPAE